MQNILRVGMADLKCVEYPGILTTLGLGSCVGIALFDTQRKVIGLAHIMLPSSSQARSIENPAKFADTAIINLLEDMERNGARLRNIVAKLAGGAQMFAFSKLSSILNVGERNVASAKEKLNELNIPIISEDTGGNYGRTIEFYSNDGSLLIKTIGHGVKKI
ncbi:MAG TPA: chemotaxis protein CheD [Clostridiaceae bacterium]|nr:chemotaxis protein CheD [Clostridiaceae bacterium]